jgi:hypothetical protein
VGVRHALFPGPALGAAKAAGFPTLFSTASGVVGLIAGPSSALRPLESCGRPLSSLGLVVAPPACEPGRDMFVTSAPRLYHFALGRPPRVAVRWPSATGLTSYLSGCVLLTSQRCVFYIAGVLEAFGFALPLCFPERELCLSRLSAPLLVAADPEVNPPESSVPC